MQEQGIAGGSLNFFGDVFEFNYPLEALGLEVVGAGRLLETSDDEPLLSDGRLGNALLNVGKSYVVDHIELIDLGMNRLCLTGMPIMSLRSLLKGVPSVQSAREADRLEAASCYLRQLPRVDGGPRVY